MKIVCAALIVAAVIGAVSGREALAQSQPAHVVTYMEVAPSAAADAAGLLRQLAAASRKETGNLRYEVLQQIGRPGHFAILETWSDAKAFGAHVAGSAMKQFRGQLDPLRVAFYDERPNTGIDTGAAGSPGKDAIYVVTHVDVPGQFKDEAIVLMKKLAADSRREGGSERFDAWQQNNRLNHSTVVEVWKDQAMLDAHGVAPTTREFREKLGPMMGALYDDRRYKYLE
jgi:quinol monooxygenase YgiN